MALATPHLDAWSAWWWRCRVIGIASTVSPAPFTPPPNPPPFRQSPQDQSHFQWLHFKRGQDVCHQNTSKSLAHSSTYNTFSWKHNQPKIVHCYHTSILTFHLSTSCNQSSGLALDRRLYYWETYVQSDSLGPQLIKDWHGFRHLRLWCTVFVMVTV